MATLRLEPLEDTSSPTEVPAPALPAPTHGLIPPNRTDLCEQLKTQTAQTAERYKNAYRNNRDEAPYKDGSRREEYAQNMKNEADAYSAKQGQFNKAVDEGRCSGEKIPDLKFQEYVRRGILGTASYEDWCVGERSDIESQTLQRSRLETPKEQGPAITDLRKKIQDFNTTVKTGWCPKPEIPTPTYSLLLQETLSSDAFFEFDSATIKQSAISTLHEVAERAKQYPKANIHIKGYTDTFGTDQHNQRLSRDRADAVASALTTLGVPPERITATGMGSTDLLVQKGTKEVQAPNRRVVIELRK